MRTHLPILLTTLALLQMGCAVVPLPHATQQSHTLDGRVVDSQGNPIAGARIKLVNALEYTGTDHDPATKPTQTISGADGRFRLSSQHNFHLLWFGAVSSISAHVPRGEYWTGSLIVSHTNYATLYRDTRSKTNRHLGDLTLTPEP